MTKQLILVSPPGERLTLHMGEGTVQSVPGTPEDAFTHLVIEAGSAGPAPRPAGSSKPDRPPPPPPDIVMSFVAGRLDEKPAGTITGPLTLADLSRILDDIPDGRATILAFGRGHDD